MQNVNNSLKGEVVSGKREGYLKLFVPLLIFCKPKTTFKNNLLSF